jgi:protein-tyrosine-phosphatase
VDSCWLCILRFEEINYNYQEGNLKLMRNILLVCTGNTCRSPIAEVLLLDILSKTKIPSISEGWEIKSAGLNTITGLSASENAICAMQKEGLDLSQHRSSALHGGLVEDADLILTMTRAQKQELGARFPYKIEKIFTLAEWAGEADMDIADPYGQGIEEYQTTIQQIRKLILKWIERQAD